MSIRRFDQPEVIYAANPVPLPKPHYVGEAVFIKSRKKAEPVEDEVDE